MAEHNFVWTSKEIAGVPEPLFCGVEFVDGMIKTINLNPNREEYLMGETKFNSAIDTSAITAEWFTANVTTQDVYTFLNVVIADPSVYADGKTPADSDFESSSNLQILADGTRVELDMKIHKDLIDPELFEMMHRR